MRSHRISLTTALTFAVVILAVGQAQAQQWLIAGFDDSRLWDYTQGGGNASNPRTITPIDGQVTGIDFGSDGSLYTLTTFGGNNLYKVNPVSGLATLVGPTGLSTVVEGDLGFDPTNGQLYGLWNAVGSDQLFTLNTTTGTATVIGSIAADDPSGLAFDNSGQLWVIASNIGSGSGPSLLKVNKTNGVVLSTQSTGIVPTGAVLGADFNPLTNQLYFAAGNGSFYSESTVTGLATLIGSHGVTNASGLAFVSVPEPMTLLLAAIACAFLGAARFARPRGYLSEL